MSELIVRHDENDYFLSPVASLDQMKQRYEMMRQFVKDILVENVDFGIIPGTGNKPALYKAGAEKLTTLFGLQTMFILDEVIEDWTGEDHNGESFFYYRYTCQLKRGELVIANSQGSANSWEKKHRYRQAEIQCPVCGLNKVIKGKEEFGGGWLCWKKKGGCGAQWNDGDPAIEEQERGDVKNPDPADLVNTLQKMAQKRALVAATLIAANASDFFTQDIDDMDYGVTIEGEFKETKQEPPKDEKSKVERPYPPDVLKHGIEEKAKKYKSRGLKPNGTDRKVIASCLNDVFEGSESKRHELLLWLTGHASTKEGEMLDEYVLAIKEWLGVTFFQDPPTEFSMKEAHSALVEAQKASGQQELM